MQIDFYNNQSDPREIPKNITDKITKTGTLRDTANVQTPAIITAYNPINKNYCYIPEFNRYYFINSVSTIRNGIFEISCKCDVLQSFLSDIENAPIIAARVSMGTDNFGFNNFVPDERRKFFQHTETQYKILGDLGAPTNILMITAG